MVAQLCRHSICIIFAEHWILIHASIKKCCISVWCFRSVAGCDSLFSWSMNENFMDIFDLRQRSFLYVFFVLFTLCLWIDDMSATTIDTRVNMSDCNFNQLVHLVLHFFFVPFRVCHVDVMIWLNKHEKNIHLAQPKRKK